MNSQANKNEDRMFVCSPDGPCLPDGPDTPESTLGKRALSPCPADWWQQCTGWDWHNAFLHTILSDFPLVHTVLPVTEKT